LNSGAIAGIGAVAETFRIGKHEVTNAQYVEFLNAVAKFDINGLWDANMQSNVRGGIRRFGSLGSFQYANRLIRAGKIRAEIVPIVSKMGLLEPGERGAAA